MLKQSLSQTGIRQSWKPDLTNHPYFRRKQIFFRLFSLAILIGIVVVFGILLFTPFYHPITHLYFMTTGSFDRVEGEIVPFAQSDAIRFLQVDGSLRQEELIRQFHVIESPESFQQSIGKMASDVRNSSDVAIVYLAGHLRWIDGRASLVVSQADPMQARANGLSIQELIEAFKRFPSSTTLLLLDLQDGSESLIERESHEDVVEQIRNQLQKSPIESLWVITSRSVNESSYPSVNLQASIFAHAVALGLRGNGDTNSDRKIDLEEFHQFVAQQTAKQVKLESNGKAKQTCLLLPTGSSLEQPANQRIIASAPPQNWIESLIPSFLASMFQERLQSANESIASMQDSLTSKDEADKPPEEKGWLSNLVAKKSELVKDMVAEEMTDNIGFLPSFIGDRVRKVVGLDIPEVQGPSPSNNAEPQPDETPENATSTPENKSADSSVKVKPPKSQTTSPNHAIPDLSLLGSRSLDNPQLLGITWQFTNYLDHGSVRGLRPVDFAPLHWKSFLDHLQRWEMRQRYDAVIDQKHESMQLMAELLGSYQLARNEEVRFGVWPKKLAEQRRRLGTDALPLCPSIGLIETMEAFGGLSIPQDLRKQINLFDESIRSEDRTSFDAWISQRTNDLPEQYHEFFTAKLLASHRPVPWAIVKKILELQRRFERVVHHPFSTNQEIEEWIDRADRLRLQGMRSALDQIESSWEKKCLEWLEQSDEFLQKAESGNGFLLAAWQLRNDLMRDLEPMIQWEHVLRTRLGDSGLEREIEEVLNQLQLIAALLEEREVANPIDVERAVMALRSPMQAISESWNAIAQSLASESESSLPIHWTLDSLLTTPLVRTPLRTRLASTHLLPQPSSTTEMEPSLWDSQSIGTKLQSRNYLQTLLNISNPAPLELNLPGGLISQRALEQSLTETIPASLDQLYGQIQESIRRLESEGFSGRNSGSSLRERLTAIRRADHQLRILPCRWTDAIREGELMQGLWKLELIHRIHERLTKIESEFNDAVPIETIFLQSARSRLAQLETSLNGEMLPRPSSKVRVSSSGTQTLSLIASPQADAEIRWKNQGTSLDQIWIILDYDKNIFEVEASPGIQVYHAPRIPIYLSQAMQQAEVDLVASLQTQDETRSIRSRERIRELAERQAYPPRPLVGSIPPSTDLTEGKEVVLPLSIRRVGSGNRQSKIVCKLVGEGIYQRHELEVELPSTQKIKLASDGLEGSWSPTGEGILFHPRTEKVTEYRLGVSGSGLSSRTYRAELFLLNERRDITLPSGILSQDATRLIEQELGDKTLIASQSEVKIESGTSIEWLTFRADQASKSGSQEESIPQDPPTTESEDAKAISLRNGMVLRFTDQESQEASWHRIDTRVRHPRGYVAPMVSYDGTSERINLQLKSLLREDSHPKGIEVRGRIVEPMPKGTEVRLDGTLHGEETLNLSCQIPVAAPRELTIELDVDDFPRAFVFRVPCWKTTSFVPVQSEQSGLRIIQPSPGYIIGPKQSTTQAKILVDAIPGAFGSRRDFIEIGWDIDRDRELRGEPSFRLAMDRQIEVKKLGMTQGKLKLKAIVNDLTIDLPLPSKKNAIVNLIARMSAAGDQVWSDPIEVVSDFDPPRITGTEVSPSLQVRQGQELVLRVGVDDGELSGVAKVEAVTKPPGSLKFDPEDSLMACERQSDGSWTVKIPTKPLELGKASLLVRAWDLAGNESPPHRLGIDVFSEEEWNARIKSQGQEVSGVVYFGQSVLANAKVTLLDEKGEIRYAATTNIQGIFRFDKVEAGKYKVSAIGVAKNRPRKAEQEIEVALPPASPIRLKLIGK